MREAIARMFERNLAAVATALEAPATHEPGRARRIVALLAETLGGYGYGLVAGEVGRALATWFGAEAAARVRTAARATAPRPPLPAELEVELGHAPRALAVELIASLRVRFGSITEQLADLVAEAPRLDGWTVRLAAQLESDDRVAVEILTGWRHACAVIERRSVELEASPRARELWRTWSRLAGHVEPDAASERELILRIG